MRGSVLSAFPLALAFAVAGVAASGAAQRGGGGQLQMYTATVERGVATKLVEQGYDVARIRPVPGGAQVEVELVLRPHEVAKLKAQLEAQGVELKPWRGADRPDPLQDRGR